MKVLLGVGGGGESFEALDRTIERTILAGDDLTIAIFEDPDGSVDLEETRERVESQVANRSLSVDIKELEGNAGPALVELAEQEGYSQIVISGGTRSPMGKINIGSVAEFVLLNATTSVKLIR